MAPVEDHSFAFEPKALLHPGMPAQFDFTAGTDDAVPGDGAVRGAQGPGNLPGVARKSGGASHLAVSRDFAFGNLPNRTG